ncbi:MAG: sulfite exporter TauE/SafE family protein [Ilumatobacter sp.]|uniref:sulfite exporter TauE/SafE family protein n=1 Tax=Ilumatobacter sp. TaxID=1967498 RepID=UPI0032997BEC
MSTTIELTVIGVAAMLTSILSAVAGLGGGVILLLVIAQFVAPTTAIPIQGAIQLVSNGSRAGLLRRDIAWPVVGWSSILVLPGSALGVLIATSLPQDAIRVVLATFVLVLAWRPGWLKPRAAGTVPVADPAHSPSSGRRTMLLGLGAASGLLNTTVGASGPVTSPFYRAVTASRVAFVATAATTQVSAHAAKLIAFASDGWSADDHTATIAVGIVGVAIGSRVGTSLLGRISTTHLDLLFRVVLTALAARLLVTAVL